MDNDEKESINKTSVDNIIALCNILNDYDEFYKNLKMYFQNKKNIIQEIYTLLQFSMGKKCIYSKDLKIFYLKNKNIIDKINQNIYINNFIYENFEFNNEIVENSTFTTFHKYLKKHKDELDKIQLVLQKIKQLGISKLAFDENLDFSKSNFELRTTFYLVTTFAYLDNMETIPNYQKDIIEYKTANSNYRIDIERLLDTISPKSSTIILNSLTFDYNRLPEELTKQSTFYKIVNLKNEQNDICNAIRNSVALSVSLDDLTIQFNSTNRIIENLDSIDSKNELHEILLKIKENLEQLQTISTEYNKNISQENLHITLEKLEKEKQLYLQRRYWSNIDID